MLATAASSAHTRHLLHASHSLPHHNTDMASTQSTILVSHFVVVTRVISSLRPHWLGLQLCTRTQCVCPSEDTSQNSAPAGIETTAQHAADKRIECRQMVMSLRGTVLTLKTTFLQLHSVHRPYFAPSLFHGRSSSALQSSSPQPHHLTPSGNANRQSFTRKRQGGITERAYEGSRSAGSSQPSSPSACMASPSRAAATLIRSPTPATHLHAAPRSGHPPTPSCTELAGGRRCREKGSLEMGSPKGCSRGWAARKAMHEAGGREQAGNGMGARVRFWSAVSSKLQRDVRGTNPRVQEAQSGDRGVCFPRYVGCRRVLQS